MATTVGCTIYARDYAGNFFGNAYNLRAWEALPAGVGSHRLVSSGMHTKKRPCRLAHESEMTHVSARVTFLFKCWTSFLSLWMLFATSLTNQILFSVSCRACRFAADCLNLSVKPSCCVSYRFGALHLCKLTLRWFLSSCYVLFSFLYYHQDYYPFLVVFLELWHALYQWLIVPLVWHWLILRCQICTFQPLYIITRQREMKSSTVASAVWRHCWKL